MDILTEQTTLSASLQVVRGVAEALAAYPHLPDLLPNALEQFDPILQAGDFVVLLLWDSGEGTFRVRAARGAAIASIDELDQIALQRGEGITGKAYDLTRSVSLPSSDQVMQWMQDLHPENRAAIDTAFGDRFNPHQMAAIPLAAGPNKFGVILFGSLTDSPTTTPENLSYLETLANLLSLAIDRARLEEELSAAREAGLSGRLQAEALATLSHELRTPLAAIKGYSTAMLLEEVTWPDEKRREFLKLIDHECGDLEIMINDILDAALIDIDQLTLEPQPVRLERLAQEIADEMQGRADDHRLVVDFPPDLPILDADPRRIKQVMRNILDNAIKYSPDGGLIMIRSEKRAHDIVVSIANQGVGISPEDLIPLFDRYFRVKSPTGYYVAGTGLGLPVARAIVEAHGGRIWAQSTVGEGTTLSFSLPIIDEDEATDQSPGLTASGGEGAG